MELLDETPDGEVLDAPVKPGTIRIILADSQAIYRVGIRKIFALEDDIRVVAQADSLDNLRTALERHPADVVLMRVRNQNRLNFAIADCFKIRQRILSGIFRVHSAIQQQAVSANLKIVRIRTDLGPSCEVYEFQMQLH